MKRNALILATTLLLLPPILINSLGWDLYFRIDFGENDLTLSAISGVAHLAWSESRKAPPKEDEKNLHHEEHSEMTISLIEIGSIHLFSEERFEYMRGLNFGYANHVSPFNYKSIEFPWLLLPLITLLGLRRNGRNRVARGFNSPVS